MDRFARYRKEHPTKTSDSLMKEEDRAAGGGAAVETGHDENIAPHRRDSYQSGHSADEEGLGSPDSATPRATFPKRHEDSSTVTGADKTPVPVRGKTKKSLARNRLLSNSGSSVVSTGAIDEDCGKDKDVASNCNGQFPPPVAVVQGIHPLESDRLSDLSFGSPTAAQPTQQTSERPLNLKPCPEVDTAGCSVMTPASDGSRQGAPSLLTPTSNLPTGYSMLQVVPSPPPMPTTNEGLPVEAEVTSNREVFGRDDGSNVGFAEFLPSVTSTLEIIGEEHYDEEAGDIVVPYHMRVNKTG
jgi:hypothetical protein